MGEGKGTASTAPAETTEYSAGKEGGCFLGFHIVVSAPRSKYGKRRVQGCREGDMVIFLTARDELIAVLAAAMSSSNRK